MAPAAIAIASRIFRIVRSLTMIPRGRDEVRRPPARLSCERRSGSTVRRSFDTGASSSMRRWDVPRSSTQRSRALARSRSHCGSASAEADGALESAAVSSGHASKARHSSPSELSSSPGEMRPTSRSAMMAPVGNGPSTFPCFLTCQSLGTAALPLIRVSKLCGHALHGLVSRPAETLERAVLALPELRAQLPSIRVNQPEGLTLHENGDRKKLVPANPTEQRRRQQDRELIALRRVEPDALHLCHQPRK